MNFIKFSKNRLIKGMILLLLAVMLINPGATFRGASSGLLLWFHNVLPNLLPFIIISNLLIRLNMTYQISRVFYPILGKLLHISSEGCYPLIFGFLSGIPMGAKSSADLVIEQKITQREGQFLTGLCNNASPMFILGYIAITQLKLPQIKYALFAIIYVSSILGALLVRFFQRKNVISLSAANSKVATAELTVVKPKRFSFEMVDASIMNGFEIVTRIGGYIILFSILAGILKEFGPDSGLLKATLVGIIEITTGVSQVCNADISIQIKIVLVSVLTTFGGLSGIAQTKSVIQSSRLSIRSYVIVKLVSAAIALLITYLYVVFLFKP